VSARTLRLALAFGIAAALAAAGVTGSANDDAHAQARGVLDALRAHDAKLTAEVLDARANLVFGYDGLVRIQREIDALAAQLAQLAPVGDPEVAAAFKQLEATRRRKADLVERFKSENAILRNSRHYLPSLAQQLQSAVATGAITPATAKMVEQLLHDTAAYGREGGSYGRDDLETTAFLLSGSGDDESLIETAAIHAQILLDHAPVVDELIAQIRACPTQDGVAKLDSALAEPPARASR
jgi:hypothetical protein